MTPNHAPTPGPRRPLGRGVMPAAAAPADPEPVTGAASPAGVPEAVSGGGDGSPEAPSGGPGNPYGAARPAAATSAAAKTVPGAAARSSVTPSGGTEPATETFAGSSAPGALPAEPAGVRAEDDAASGDSEDNRVFTVRLDNFEGPFDLLLQLISRHKLDVTEVALSKVTDEFMGHIRAMGAEWDLDRTTEFLVVAATLLDLKAARLLPAAEVEDEADLALLEARDLLFARLLQYRAYKQIADIFNERLEDEGRRHPRTVGLEPHHAELLPEVVISIGPEGFARLAVKAMQPKAEPQVYVDHIHAPLVSVQEQAGIVVARLRELGESDFRALVADTDDTLTVVARFLALLELYREKAVALEQEAALGTLLVRWTGGESGAAPRVTDEFDRPPEKARDEKAEEQKT